MPRKTITTLSIALLGMTLLGCSVQRSPLVTVAPSYSYLQAQPQLAEADIWPVQTTLRASNAEGVPVAMLGGYGDESLYRGHLTAEAQPIDPSRAE